MSYKDNNEIERLGGDVALSFECVWPIYGLMNVEAIANIADLMAVSARRDVPELMDSDLPEMGDEKKRKVLVRYFQAIADKFTAFCDPLTASVPAGLSAEVREKKLKVFTADVAQSFRIHITAASELVENGMPLEEVAKEAQNVSRERIINTLPFASLPKARASRHKPAAPLR
jgi:hypothetical protein